MINQRRISVVSSLCIGLLLTACGEEAVGEDGVMLHCAAGQKKDPENFLGGDTECACVADKLSGFLSSEHYAVFATYNESLTLIAEQLPQLHGPEFHARAIKAVSATRSESPSVIVAQLSEVRGVTSPAYQWCGVVPSR